MSCTVVAVPVVLAQIIVPLIAGGVAAIAKHVSNEEFDANYNENSYNTELSDEKIRFMPEKQFVEQQFETQFMDKEILMKTLEEHGLNSINDYGEEISGVVENYTLTFKKQAEDKPYMLTVKSLSEKANVEKVNEISSEYAMNAQEDSYLSIIKNLKANNMEIEEEEVLDDNTIVLTINVDG
ncbi:MAG: hypothetical protein MJ231_07855 [bacterium]|nr:hypothetical protein [bacterium]